MAEATRTCESMSMWLHLRGARVHNLASVDLDLPLGKLIVFTGPSGSGKSSLAFSTIYTESQRRFVETLSPSLRRRLGQAARPDFESLLPLPPTFGLAQLGAENWGARSTVGSLGELRPLVVAQLLARGQAHCPACGTAVQVRSPDHIAELLAAGPPGAKLLLFARVMRGQKSGFKATLSELSRAGFVRVRLDGELLEIEDVGPVDSRQPHDLEVLVDRLKLGPERLDRLRESVETGLRIGKGSLIAEIDGVATHFVGRPVCPSCEATLPELSPQLFSRESPAGACADCKGVGCATCRQTGLRGAAQSLKLEGLSLPELESLPVHRLRIWLQQHPGGPALIAEELDKRLLFLERCGLGYLCAGRSVDSLSSGELQRLRLSTVLGSSLSGMMYILDEPTAGLSPSEVQPLLDLLRERVEAGNTVIVVEHDPMVMRAADHVVDFGPGAGPKGGRIVFEGSPKGLEKADTITGRWLSGRETLETALSPPCRGLIHVKGASGNNLKDLSLTLPLGVLLGVGGTSGAGKSSLIFDTVGRALRQRLGEGGQTPLPVEHVEGPVSRVIMADPGPAGRSNRSTVATLCGLWAGIRLLLSMTAEAKTRGFGPERFGLGAGPGRCGGCGGLGLRRLSLELLPTLELPCDRCGGQRWDSSTLSVRWKGKNAAELLALSVAEARRLFTHHRRIARVLQRLEDLGLGYLSMGQRGSTLSGGERQRLRLARELERSSEVAGTLYLLDEPSVGLHPSDVSFLLTALRGLVAAGGTVWIVDPDPALLGACDARLWLGPGGGEQGGQVVGREGW